MSIKVQFIRLNALLLKIYDFFKFLKILRYYNLGIVSVEIVVIKFSIIPAFEINFNFNLFQVLLFEFFIKLLGIAFYNDL